MAAHLAPLTPHASALHFFGAELRHRRLDVGLSIRQLAPRVLAHHTLLGKVELAQRFPSLDLAQRCDEELDAGGALVRLHGLVVAERAASGDDAPAVTAALNAVEVAAALRLLSAVALAAFADASDGAAMVLDRIDSVLQSADSARRSVRLVWRPP